MRMASEMEPEGPDVQARGVGIRIVRCRTLVVSRENRNAQWNPRTRWTTKNVVLAIVEAASGEIGVGEAYCDGGSPDSVRTIIEQDIGPQLLAGVSEPAQLWRVVAEQGVVSAKGGALYAALSAVDIALWDLKGRRLGVPLWRLLGGCASRVPAYASGGLYGADKSPADLGAEMASYVAQGFRAVKIKVGGASLDEDCARVRAVREAIGPGIRLMVDALYALSPDAALAMARRIERDDVHFLEAPVHPDDVQGMARLARSSPVPLAGNEFAFGLSQFRALLQADAVSVVHLDAILCGGITEAMRIVALAAAYHRPVSFHAASSAVCFAANLHVAGAVPNAESIEYHMIHRLLFDRIPDQLFPLENGCVVLPETPGLGFDASGWE